ncbi:MAG TPA: hypothetical protein ENF96_01975 [Archaeoglobus veneficus]|nr:hypothetical protein [Archaeoglobus veneficus]
MIEIPKSEIFRDIAVVKDYLLEDRYSVIYKGRLVGYIVDRGNEKVFVTVRVFNEHFFRIYEGYGISAPVLALLRANRVNKVVIIEKLENGERLLVSRLEDWFEKGFRYTFEFPDGSKDPQRVLPVCEMEVK